MDLPKSEIAWPLAVDVDTFTICIMICHLVRAAGPLPFPGSNTQLR